MSSTHPTLPVRPETGSRATSAGPWRRFLERLSLILGGIALFLGVFVLFAGEDQSIGFFGEWSVQADEVTGFWTAALLIGGAVLVGLALWSIVPRRRGQAEGG